MSSSIDTQRSTITITVRYFAAARSATGIDEERMTVHADSHLADALTALSATHGDEFARVLNRCSYLHNAVAVHDVAKTMLADGDSIDVLPPFAGG